jgi:hypothetical protein
MSNHLAVAATTRTLAHLLDRELTEDFAAAHAVPGRPDANVGNADPQARIFLYRVEPNAAWRTTALPSRSPTGQVYERPQIGLTLHYLVTFVGNEALQEPQRILGSVMRTLNSRPVLTRTEIEAMVAAAVLEDPASPMALADLAEQPEVVRVSPLPLTLDELSSLWSSFFQTPYQLSVAYEASVVVLTADDLPTRSLPVRERQIFTTTMLRPTIGAAEAEDGLFHPVQVGTTLVITGNQLQGDDMTVVAFGGIEVVPDPALVTGARIEVEVPADARAGAVGLRVIHRRAMGDPPQPRLAGQSAAFPVVVQPRITTAADVHDLDIDAETGLRSGGITVSVEPMVGSRQMVTLFLNAVPSGTGQSFVFEDERRDGPGDPDETADLDIAFAGVPAGDYLYRVTVDGAETPLEVGAAPGPTEGQYVGPVVSVP